jgi:hypothetical protein
MQNNGIAGIIYLYPIDNIDLPTNKFPLFCGEGTMEIAVLATTMWDCIKQDLGQKREEALKTNCWKHLLDFGSTYMRYEGTFRSAWAIVDTVPLDPPIKLEITEGQDGSLKPT